MPYTIDLCTEAFSRCVDTYGLHHRVSLYKPSLSSFVLLLPPTNWALGVRFEQYCSFEKEPALCYGMDNICSRCIDIILLPCSPRTIGVSFRISWILRAGRCWEHSLYRAFLLMPYFFLHFFVLFFLVCFTLVGWLGSLLCFFLFSFYPSSIPPPFFQKNSALCSTVSLSSLSPFLCLFMWFCG